MIFKILLSRSVQTPNNDKNWQTSCPLQTFVCNVSWHWEFIIEQGHRVNWISGSLDSRVTGSLGHKMWPSSMSGASASRLDWLSETRATAALRPINFVTRVTNNAPCYWVKLVQVTSVQFVRRELLSCRTRHICRPRHGASLANCSRDEI